MPMDLTDDKSGSGSGLAPSGYKPSPDPMLTQNSVATWRYKDTRSQYSKYQEISRNFISRFNSFRPNDAYMRQ